MQLENKPESARLFPGAFREKRTLSVPQGPWWAGLSDQGTVNHRGSDLGGQHPVRSPALLVVCPL